MSTVDVEIVIGPNGRFWHRERPEPPAAAAPIPRITRLMALAIKFQTMVDRREVRDYADLARLGYVSRARLTQVMNLLLLAPDIQELLLLPDARTAKIHETYLRAVVNSEDWAEQRQLWELMRTQA